MLDSFKFSDFVGAVTRKLRLADDTFRIRATVLVEVRDKYGNLKSRSFQKNMRVNNGADFWNTQLFALSPGAAGANYLALSTDTSNPNATDSSLPSEITSNGLQRVQVTPTHTSTTSVTTFSHQWTYTGSTATVVAKAGLLNASSGGTLVLETLLNATATVNNNGDTITVTWTINY